MIKNIFQKTVLTAALLGTSLVADYSSYTYDGYSLVGVEGGYSNLSADLTDLSDNPKPYKGLDGNAYHVGMKIGAQTGHYRIFLNASMHKDSDDAFDYLTSYGVEGQYLFSMFPQADFFISAGGGIVTAKYVIAGESKARTINDSYFSGGMGFNIHATDWIDVELGGRYMSIDAANVQDEKEYRLNDMMSVYTSIIFKYKMD